MTHVRWAAGLVLIMAGVAAAGTPVIKEIQVSSQGAIRGGFGKPNVLKTAASIGKAFPDLQTQTAIAKQFTAQEQQLLLFRWAGSGQDRLTHEVVDGKIVFTYQPGRTRDLRRHQKLYAVRKGVSWEIKKPTR